jgi:hypothetical protein
MKWQERKFSLEELGFTPEEIAEMRAKAAARRRRFIMLPDAWEAALRKARHISTYRVAFFLIRQDWKAKGQPITVPNAALAAWGASRRRKSEAMLELEAFGLIEIEQHGRHAACQA